MGVVALMIGPTVAQVQNHVELLKVTAILMMIALVISYVDQTTASIHFHIGLTAAMTPLQVLTQNYQFKVENKQLDRYFSSQSP